MEERPGPHSSLNRGLSFRFLPGLPKGQREAHREAPGESERGHEPCLLPHDTHPRQQELDCLD